jgi:NitT/TauT family transport system substrate-binding protein
MGMMLHHRRRPAGGLRGTARAAAAYLALAAIATVGVGCGASAGAPASATRAAAPSATAASASAGSKAAAPLFSLTSIWTAPSALFLPEWVAADKGLFKAHGLDVHLLFANARSKPVAILLSGKAQILQTVVSNVILADRKGADLVAVGMPVDAAPEYLYTVPSIATAQGLKGHVVADTAPATATDIAATVILQHYGLTVGKDVQVRHLGSSTAILAALKAGQVQGGILDPPLMFSADALGLHRMVSLAQFHYVFPIAWPVVSRAWARKHAGVVRGYLAALTEANAFIHAHPRQSQAVMAKYMKLQGTKLAAETYQAMVNVFPSNLTPSLTGVKNTLDLLRQQGVPGLNQYTPQQFVDASYVK